MKIIPVLKVNFNHPRINFYNNLAPVIAGCFYRHPGRRAAFFFLHFLYTGCLVIGSAALFTSCSVSKQIAHKASKILLKDTAIRTGHIGISIYEPATGRYWYNYDATKYFVPASNTKLFTLYAGMKYLGDSLVGLRYEINNDSTLRIQATGDPSFLHTRFLSQPVFNFLSRFIKITFTNSLFTENFLGRGWAWDDYKEPYMPQRSNFPVYGNVMTVKKTGDTVTVFPGNLRYFLPAKDNMQPGFDVIKKWDSNFITITNGINQHLSLPFSPNAQDIMAMLRDTLHSVILPGPDHSGKLKYMIRSQPSDSLFKPMIHFSDNFFAEQTLLMVSNELLGYMDDEKIINTILNTDLRDIPQQPKWVDGSGLSRYNLFTPHSFVYLLNKMQQEFGIERLKNILPTGGEGTLAAYFKKEAGFIFAKTGTLSNHCALSGFIITKKNNRQLVFSILANHYQTGATPVQRAVEKFLTEIMEKY